MRITMTEIEALKLLGVGSAWERKWSILLQNIRVILGIAAK